LVARRHLPCKRDHCVIGVIALPTRRALEQLPRSVAQGWNTKRLQQSFIERRNPRIGWLIRSTAQVRRNSLLLPFKLALVKEPQPRRAKRNHRRRLVHRRRKRRGRTRLVMVFEKPGEFVLIVESRPKML